MLTRKHLHDLAFDNCMGSSRAQGDNERLALQAFGLRMPETTKGKFPRNQRASTFFQKPAWIAQTLQVVRSVDRSEHLHRRSQLFKSSTSPTRQYAKSKIRPPKTRRQRKSRQNPSPLLLAQKCLLRHPPQAAYSKVRLLEIAETFRVNSAPLFGLIALP